MVKRWRDSVVIAAIAICQFAPAVQPLSSAAEAQQAGGEATGGEEPIEEMIRRMVEEALARELAKREAELEAREAQLEAREAELAKREAELGKEEAEPEKPLEAVPDEPMKPRFDLQGGAYVWHYQPMDADFDPFSEIWFAYVVLDVSFGNFNLHFDPRVRDTRFRSYADSSSWVEEVYLSWQPPKAPGLTFKAGKFYTRLGKFWDDNFTGNIHFHDGLKLDPDFGVGIEGTVPLAARWDAEYALQFFTIDGTLNGSLAGRDTLSIPGAEQRDQWIGRFAPRYSWKEGHSVLFGLSGQTFEADFAEGSPIADDRVERFAAELEFRFGGLNLWAEYIEHSGFAVLDFPLPGRPSDDIRYTWAGISYKYRNLDFRFLHTTGDYRTSGVKETITSPGIIIDLNEHVRLWFEYIDWQREEPGGFESTVDDSLTTALQIYF